MKKEVNLNDSINIYKRLADDKADGGDLLGALGLYLTVLKTDERDLNAIADVADCYADMGLLELSNRYWFKFLTVCPKDKQGIAYEELAINYFYLDNLWAAGFYFHLKVERDGFIAEEGLDEEIIEFFSSPQVKKEDYYIAYPFNLADYSGTIKNAKRAFAAGDLPRAINLYRKVPEECMTEEAASDYATALFLYGKDEESVEACKTSIERYGENVNAFCNLSSLYHARGNDDKARYYYGRALSARKGDKEESFKIAACAVELGDNITAKECLSVILSERPYDDIMNFFYALALMNLGEYEAAADAMNKTLRLVPTDSVYRFYAELFEKIVADRFAADGLLPFAFIKALPSETERAYKREITKYINGKGQFNGAKDETRKMLELALRFEDKKTAKAAAFLLASADKNKDIIYSALLDNDVDDEIKNTLVYLLVSGGEKRPINVVLGNYFASVKTGKVVFENKPDGLIYMSAYALAVAKAASWGIDDCVKLAFNMNTLYTDYFELIRFNGFGAEVIAAIAFTLCDFPRIAEVKGVCAAFGVDKAQVDEVAEFIEHVKKTAHVKAKERAAKAASRKSKVNKEKDVD
ncbi:MAG: hypothetical protein IJQ23_02955 [Clostridia bacterium]|nr:hypothetical protein [Clostridia bacterium]